MFLCFKKLVLNVLKLEIIIFRNFEACIVQKTETDNIFNTFLDVSSSFWPTGNTSTVDQSAKQNEVDLKCIFKPTKISTIKIVTLIDAVRKLSVITYRHNNTLPEK